MQYCLWCACLEIAVLLFIIVVVVLEIESYCGALAGLELTDLLGFASNSS